MAPKDKKGLIVLVVLGLILFFTGQKKAGGGGGAALPSGNIAGVITLAQGNMARTHAHLVTKTAGAQLAIGVTWVAATKNSLGQPIPWNYGISYRFRENAAAVGNLVFGGWANIGSRPNGTFTFTFNDVTALNALNYPIFAGKNWDVQVTLHADSSSPTGQPLGDMPALEDDALPIGFGEHLNAFQVV